MSPPNPIEQGVGQDGRIETSGPAPRVVLQTFQGPLDLLLHLIRINEISITDIPIVEICRQYDEYLDLMQELNLDLAGEYLVMAATLTYIKSRTLLPAPSSSPCEELEDPRADLVRQLMEYERIKGAADTLLTRDRIQSNTFIRGHAGEDPLGPYRKESLLDVSLFDLLSAFKKLVESLGDAQPLQVERDEISVAEKIAWILDRLEEKLSCPLLDLLQELETRRERIVAFLAILELIRLQLVTARQRRMAGEIILTRAEASSVTLEEGPDA